MKKILYLVAHRPDRSPGQRFRFEQYLDYLAANGFEYEISYLLNEQDDRDFYSPGKYFRKFLILLKSVRKRFGDINKAKQADIVFIYREAVMFGSTYFERRLNKNGAKIILDYDDAIWLMDVSEGNKNLKWLKRPSKTGDICGYSRLVITGNNYLADYARQFAKQVAVIPTTLVTDIFKRIDTPKIGDAVCIGWTGSSTTLKHLESALPFLKELKSRFRDKISFRVIADKPFLPDDPDFEFCKWSKETEVADLCAIDIGIMPLPDDEWARGKCGFKGLQYMALGIPAVMSPVGVNTEIISDGVNGFLASSVDEWVEKLSQLIESPGLRLQFGTQGRKTIEERYSFNSQKATYLELFRDVAAG
ncbi:MAG: glycosyltransferase family 4 protein [Bacteroidota bacterium]